MDELAKLRTLLYHWTEHNIEHAETYREWADKAASLGKSDLADILRKLHDETKKLNDLFSEAEKKLQHVK